MCSFKDYEAGKFFFINTDISRLGKCFFSMVNTTGVGRHPDSYLKFFLSLVVDTTTME